MNFVQVMEIGSVGKNFPEDTKTFFAHTAGVRHCLDLDLSLLLQCYCYVSGFLFSSFHDAIKFKI